MPEDLLQELIMLARANLEKQSEEVAILRRLGTTLDEFRDRIVFAQPIGSNMITKLSEISSKLSTIAARLK